MSKRHTYRSLYAIHQYVSIIRALHTCKSQNTKESKFEDTKRTDKNGYKRKKNANTNRQNSTQKQLSIQQHKPTKDWG